MSKTRPFACYVGEEAVVLDNPRGVYNPETQLWEDEGMPAWKYAGPTNKKTGSKGITAILITSPCGQDYYYDYDDSESD
jgi:hypothetical protein